MLSKTAYPVLVLLLSIAVIEFFNSTKPKHPYAGLNIEQLVQKYGYPIERHEVTTDDGYILTLHRIPYGHNETNEKRVPMLFMHGFAQSAKDFVNLGPKNSLSLLLVDKGYDIWLGNARGTTWSRKHKVLNPMKETKFWDFSMEEIGVYDTAAFIDYILKVTSENSLHYVGYSQGTMVFFILGSQKPQYMQKIKLMTALAPAMFLKDPIGPILNPAAQNLRYLELFFKYFNFWEILSEDSFISRYLRHICNENSLFVDLCLHQLAQFQGYDLDQVNKTALSLIHTNTPAGGSRKQIIYVVQLMDSGNFHRYDFGTDGNLERYGQKEAPEYNVTNVKAPVALYYSNNDWSINIKNMDRVINELPNVVKSYRVPLSEFNHNDFIYAKNVTELLYKEVIDEILKY